MLLPSFACDQSQSQQMAALAPLWAASPPNSPPPPTAPLGNLFATCRNLQSLLTAPAPAAAATPTTVTGLAQLPLPLPLSLSLPPRTPPSHHHHYQQDYHHEQAQLPTPPLAHAPSPMKLRLRSRSSAVATSANTLWSASSTSSSSSATTTTPDFPRKRIVKRAVPATRSLHKRRRSTAVPANEGELSADDTAAASAASTRPPPSPSTLLPLAPSPFRRPTTPPPSSMPIQEPPSPSCSSTPPPSLSLSFSSLSSSSSSSLPSSSSLSSSSSSSLPSSSLPSSSSLPRTPRRSRIAPAVLPLGLERGDFHALHAEDICDDAAASASAAGAPATDVRWEADGESWSTEEDRMLVELVLEKLRLSKTDWQDCARTLGKKDRHSLGRRWKSLMLHGDVGLLKHAVRGGGGASRRSKIHGTWR